MVREVREGPRPECPYRAERNPRGHLKAAEAGLLTVHYHGAYQTRAGLVGRWRCLVCCHTFSHRTGTARAYSRQTLEEQGAMLDLYVKGSSFRAIAENQGVNVRTVERRIRKAASHMDRVTRRVIRGHRVHCLVLEVDEFQTPVGGRWHWVWLGLHAETRLLAPPHISKGRGKREAKRFLKEARAELEGDPVLLESDGHRSMVVARKAWMPSSVHAQIIKKRRRGRVVKVNRRVATGQPMELVEAFIRLLGLGERVSINHVERVNLTIRWGSRRLMKASIAKFRGVDCLRSFLVLFRAHYNYIRPHLGLRKLWGGRITPAMAAGLTTRPWAWPDLILMQAP